MREMQRGWRIRLLKTEEFLSKEVFKRPKAKFFITTGQHIHSMVYLFPEEYTAAMKPLLDQATFKSFSDVEKLFQEEFGKKPTEMYSSIEREQD
jgi:predicted unusual protein kinase regulating ubiquinone biosynthesis (AarF/ABC1/UbiB family)